MSLPYNEAALEIFRDVVQGPENTGMPEILAILKKHFDPAIQQMKPRCVRQVLADLEDDDEDEHPAEDCRGMVLPAI